MSDCHFKGKPIEMRTGEDRVTANPPVVYLRSWALLWRISVPVSGGRSGIHALETQSHLSPGHNCEGSAPVRGGGGEEREG